MPPPLPRRADAASASTAPRFVGRYALYGEIAAGGMATVHFGRLVGPVGFSRTVAIKRLHAHLAKDPEFVSMFLDEARLAARIQHPNVVATIDVVPIEGEVFLVMEYVQGESLSQLHRSVRKQGRRIPTRIATAIMAGALHGLHAAHEARSERGDPLNIVHRDVSPQNVMVGADGNARVLDFGVAKAAMRVQSTREGQIKGKVRYMAPEQLRGTVDRRSDVFAAGVVLWEALTGERMFNVDDPFAIMVLLAERPVTSPRAVDPSISPELEAVVMRALERDPAARYQTAREFAVDLERTGVAMTHEVGEWVERVGGASLQRRAEQVVEIESAPCQAARQTEDRDSSPPTPSASLSVMTWPEVRDRGARRTSRAMRLGGALVIAFVVTTVLLLQRRLISAQASALQASAAARSLPASAPARAPDTPAPAPEAPAPARIEQTGSAPEPPPLPRVQPSAAPSAKRARVASGTKARKPDCTLPFTVGKDGIRHPRPECL